MLLKLGKIDYLKHSHLKTQKKCSREQVIANVLQFSQSFIRDLDLFRDHNSQS